MQNPKLATMTPRPILFIDDDVAFLEAVSGALAFGLPEVSVETSVSVSPVLEQVRAREYHAIICDFSMPTMDGLELLRQMKQVRPSTPILLLTGNVQDELIKKASEAGAYDFIRKPVNRDMLILSIKRALEAHELRGHVKDTILRIDRVPVSLSVDAFRDVLAPFGRIMWLRLIRDSDEDGREAAFGYVEYATASQAEDARESLHKMALGAQRLELCLSSDVLQRRAFSDTLTANDANEMR
jgi:CheY-like chemotaxis protein